MSDPVRIGLCGAGVIAQRGIIPHLTQPDVADRVRLQAICDPVPGRAEELAQQYGVPEHFTDYAEMLAASTVDAVSIASPIGLHYEQGKAALQAGKDVHFNKTMTTTVAEATEIIDLAAAGGRKVVPSPGEILRPQNREIAKIIADGGIGRLTWVLCGTTAGGSHVNERERTRGGPSGAIQPDWYFQKPGGGPLYDTTVYPLHAMTSILGPATAVTARSGIRLPERHFGERSIKAEADDTTLMIVEFEDGLFAFVYGVTFGAPPIPFRVTFFGTEGTICGDDLNGEPIDYSDRKLMDAAGRSALLPHVVGPHREMREPHVFEDIMQLVDWIRDDEPTLVRAEQARHVIDIIESAYRSAETGQVQPLRTSFSLPGT